MAEIKTTIAISFKLKDMLDKYKIHHRESYEDAIWRIVNFVGDLDGFELSKRLSDREKNSEALQG